MLQQHPDKLDAVPRPLPLHPRRRVPGHQSRAVRADQAARRRARQRVRRRRRRSVDLRLARRGHPQHPRLQEGLSRRGGRAPRGELSLDAADPRAGERRHQREHDAHGQDAARDARAAASASPSSDRSTSATKRSSSSAKCMARRSSVVVAAAGRHRRALSHQRAEPRDRRGAAPARDSVSARRRGALLRSPRDPRSRWRISS